jgi:hypothetical protein
MKECRLSKSLPDLKKEYLKTFNFEDLLFDEEPELKIKHNNIVSVLCNKCDDVERDIFIMYCDLGSYSSVARILGDVNYQVIKQMVDKTKNKIKIELTNLHEIKKQISKKDINDNTTNDLCNLCLDYLKNNNIYIDEIKSFSIKETRKNLIGTLIYTIKKINKL